MPITEASKAASLNGMGMSVPYEYGFAITPDDNNDLPQPTRAIFVGKAGDVNAVLTGGSTVLLKTMPSALYPLQVQRILATGTSADYLVGLY